MSRDVGGDADWTDPAEVARASAAVDQDNPDRVVLVGECNPYGPDPDMALVNYPDGCSGHRLWRILGVPEDRYLAFRRLNLCDGPWRRASAVARAAALYRGLPDPGDDHAPRATVILLGVKVADACSGITLIESVGSMYRAGAVERWRSATDPVGRARWIHLPHPSGLNRAWGAGMWAPGGSVARARAALHLVAPHVPWGAEHPIPGFGVGTGGGTVGGWP